MKFIPITEPDPEQRLRGLPSMAIDLGFSGKYDSCGVATFPEDTEVVGIWNYGTLLDRVRSWIGRNGSEVVLIVEAPLSGGFDEAGNPLPRGDFERVHSQTGRSSRRYWNVAAGASMALAAIHFCRRLLDSMSSDQVTVHLLEGFASRYSTPRPDHRDVANALIARWRAGDQMLISDDGVNLISVPAILENGSRQAPAILRIPDGLSKVLPF